MAATKSGRYAGFGRACRPRGAAGTAARCFADLRAGRRAAAIWSGTVADNMTTAPPCSRYPTARAEKGTPITARVSRLRWAEFFQVPERREASRGPGGGNEPPGRRMDSPKCVGMDACAAWCVPYVFVGPSFCVTRTR